MARYSFSNILEAFSITKSSVVSVVGCNGKTSTMDAIALAHIEADEHNSALVGTTTKVGADQLPDDTQIFYSLKELKRAHAEGKLNRLGCLTGELYKGMLTDPGVDAYSEAMGYYDICVMEADGSRHKPLKAWREHDLPIHPQTTLTIGVLPIDIYGMHPTEENTHAFEKFCEVHGTVENVDAKLIYHMITLPDQLFKNSPGKKLFYINKCDSDEKLEKAEQLIAELKNLGLDLDIVFGSIMNLEFYKFL